MQWAQTEKRTFLRQRIEVRLATLYLETKDYTSSISLIGKLLTEVRWHRLAADPLSAAEYLAYAAHACSG